MWGGPGPTRAGRGETQPAQPPAAHNLAEETTHVRSHTHTHMPRCIVVTNKSPFHWLVFFCILPRVSQSIGTTVPGLT